jgi:arylsulfatase A-like enzyme
MFTSLFPSVHLVRNAAGPKGRTLDAGVLTLAEILHRAGYATAGFHGGGNLNRIYGFDHGFDLYRYAGGVDPVIEWVGKHQDRPYFAFFHTYHVHDPYAPAPPYDTLYDPDYEGKIISDRVKLDELAAAGGFRELRDAYWSRVDPSDPRDIAHLLALYDGAITEIDLELGRLFAAMDESAQPTVVVLVSDHGEAFQEHGAFIHDQLYEEVLHVPLILRHPRLREGRRVSPRVGLVDLAPTVLDLVGVAAPAQFQGVSLLPVADGKRVPEEVYSEKVRRLPKDPKVAERGFSNYALYRGDLKLIVHPRPELYDLAADPGEQQNLAADRREVRSLVARAREINRSNNEARRELGIDATGSSEALDAEAREQLKALGYLQ